MIAKDPNHLSKDDLVAIVRSARDFLFFGEIWVQDAFEDEGKLVEGYSLDNDVSGADFVEHMNHILSLHGLVPVDEVVPQVVRVGHPHYATREECVEAGMHLKECDSDGYCLYCGEQEGEECPNWEAGVRCDCNYCICQREIQQGQA